MSKSNTKNEENDASYSSDSEAGDELDFPLGDSDDEDDNVRDFMRVINSNWMRNEIELDESEIVTAEEQYDFPKDPERWTEEDLKEYWRDPPFLSSKTGWDPNWVDREDVNCVNREIRMGNDPPVAPFYVPYRKPYPTIPDNHHDIKNPKGAIQQLDRIEEFLRWVSYIFEDGSWYEGTVWDDKAHGKGVFVGEQGLVRYEGEWLHNEMEGHGVVEVEIPHIQPVPRSGHERRMRARGRTIIRDFMTPEDSKWLEMDVEDSIKFAAGQREIPFYEKKLWIKQFGRKPEKGRYRYAGQWKHGRMHGCGVYEVNEKPIYGRFYFGEYLERDTYGCDLEVSAMHAGIAEVAAAKARMFTNKPDGMVREEWGPYGDPQHPYLYEEDDVWMAPGFINQFYEVPDYWKMYMHEVDQEREMWLNSFYKAPLRLPMPAELEYWWAKDEDPEFFIFNKEPEPDPEDPSKLIYTEDPLIMHIPTGKMIDYVEDEEHGIRLFWVPDLEDLEDDAGPGDEVGEDEEGEDTVEFLPLGFDEFYGEVEEVKEEHFLKKLVSNVEKACIPKLMKLEKWAGEKMKAGEMKKELLKKELELAQAELDLKEAVEELDVALKTMEKMEERKAKMGIEEEEEEERSKPTDKSEKTTKEIEEEDEEEEEEDDDGAAFSFGSVENQDKGKNDENENENKNGRKSSPFGASSLPFAACSLVSQVPSKLLHSFAEWKKEKAMQQPSSITRVNSNMQQSLISINFNNSVAKNCRLQASRHAKLPESRVYKLPNIVRSKSVARSKRRASSRDDQRLNGESSLSILSLHSPLVL